MSASSSLTPAERRLKWAKRLGLGAATLVASTVVSGFIPGKGEIAKAAVLTTAVFADPDDAERIKAWVDDVSLSFGPTGEWNASDWAAAARRRVDASIAEKRAQAADEEAARVAARERQTLDDSQQRYLEDQASYVEMLNGSCDLDGYFVWYDGRDLAPDDPVCLSRADWVRAATPDPATFDQTKLDALAGTRRAVEANLEQSIKSYRAVLTRTCTYDDGHDPAGNHPVWHDGRDLAADDPLCATLSAEQ